VYFLSITEEKRVEHRSDLIDGFSPILGIRGYILCSIVWMVCIFFPSLSFSYSISFINSIKVSN
jgi:hypothetical protein